MFYDINNDFGNNNFIAFTSWYLKKHKWEIIDTRMFLEDLDIFFGQATAAQYVHYFK